MKLVLASTLLSVLLVQASIARADDALVASDESANGAVTEARPVAPVAPRAATDDPDAALRARPIGRCIEQPMSLAIAIAEYEASRTLEPEALVSPNGPVAPARVAALDAAPSQRRSAMPPRACLSPNDPGCRISQPLSAPHHVQLDLPDHGAAPAPWIASTVPAPEVTAVPPPPPFVLGAPRDAHDRAPWRPPA
jgi:hypothetical protein